MPVLTPGTVGGECWYTHIRCFGGDANPAIHSDFCDRTFGDFKNACCKRAVGGGRRGFHVGVLWLWLNANRPMSIAQRTTFVLIPNTGPSSTIPIPHPTQHDLQILALTQATTSSAHSSPSPLINAQCGLIWLCRSITSYLTFFPSLPSSARRTRRCSRRSGSSRARS